MGVTFSLLQRLPRSFFPWPIVGRSRGYEFCVCREMETGGLHCAERAYASLHNQDMQQVVCHCPENAWVRLESTLKWSGPQCENRSMPSTAGATIGIPPAQAVNEVFQWSVSLRRRTQFTMLKRSIPDVERFAQALSCQFTTLSLDRRKGSMV